MTPNPTSPTTLVDEFERLLKHYADGCVLAMSEHRHIISTDFDARKKAVINAYLAALHRSHAASGEYARGLRDAAQVALEPRGRPTPGACSCVEQEAIADELDRVRDAIFDVFCPSIRWSLEDAELYYWAAKAAIAVMNPFPSPRIAALEAENVELRTHLVLDAQALKPFADAVYNDNGDMTVGPVLDNYESCCRAYSAEKRLRAYFAKHPLAEGQSATVREDREC
jgi:hypothetical protein